MKVKGVYIEALELKSSGAFLIAGILKDTIFGKTKYKYVSKSKFGRIC